MCTVSFLPFKDAVVLTSNRDEKKIRSAAKPPAGYICGNEMLYYPEDPSSKGTWIITNTNGDAGILLNGAFYKHDPKPPYRLSRGTVLPSIFSAGDPLKALQLLDLKGIENFTLVLYIQNNLFECRWDGHSLTVTEKNSHIPHIWSSVTLYDEQMIHERKYWFDQWISKQVVNSQTEVIDFHASAGKGNLDYGLLMNRRDELFTVSISSLLLSQEQSKFYYRDLVQHHTTVIQLPTQNASVYND